MKYKVTKTYTPSDLSADRKREELTFETSSTDIFDVATEAYAAFLPPSDDRIQIADRRLEDDSVWGELEGQDLDCFEFLLFTNDGEYFIEVDEVI